MISIPINSECDKGFAGKTTIDISKAYLKDNSFDNLYHSGPKCTECDKNYVQIDNNCVLSCGNSIPCYNKGTCVGQTCQCSQENGIAKYYGESCDLTICDILENPCQNGGICLKYNSQVCFTRIIEKFFILLK